MSAYLQFGGNLSFRVISRAQQCSRFFQVRFCQRSWSATKPPPPPRGFKSSIDALPQYIALEFRVMQFSAIFLELHKWNRKILLFLANRMVLLHGRFRWPSL